MDTKEAHIQLARLRGICPSALLSRASTRQPPVEVQSWPFADEHGLWVMARMVIGDPCSLRKVPVQSLDRVLNPWQAEAEVHQFHKE